MNQFTFLNPDAEHRRQVDQAVRAWVKRQYGYCARLTSYRQRPTFQKYSQDGFPIFVGVARVRTSIDTLLIVPIRVTVYNNSFKIQKGA